MKESTKIKFYKAFESLYIKYDHNVELISVNELCNSCGVSRTTFYSYYETINEIFDEISEKILTVFNHLSDYILSYYIYKKKFDRKEVITELINIKTNQEFANYCFFKYPFSIIKKHCYKKYMIWAQQSEISPRKDYEFSILITSVETIIFTWKNHKYCESEEYILNLIIDTINSIIEVYK